MRTTRRRTTSPPSGRPATQGAAAGDVVRWDLLTLYAFSYAGGSLLFLAPLLVTLALKVNELVGREAAASSLALVTGVGSLLAMVSNPLFGRWSDRTTARLGMRRPWMLIGLTGGVVGIGIIATADDVTGVLVGWCTAQVFLNALLAAQTAVLPDQFPPARRGLVSGVLGVCLPVASVAATYLVQAFDGHQTAMFAAPCVVGAAAVLLFCARLPDRRLAPADKPPWSVGELLRSFYVDPRRHPDFGWVFVSRFLFVTAYAFLVTYQAFYLLQQIGSTERDVPRQIYLGTLAQSLALIATSPIAGRLSDRVGHRKAFVIAAALVYAGALGLMATAASATGYLVAMAISGVGFGAYMAVDLALVVDVLPDTATAAKDLGVLNIAGALPFAVAPALAAGILAAADNSYAILYATAGAFALLSAAAIRPVKRAR